MTVNNYTDQQIETIKTLKGLKWAIIGKEVAKTTNTPHLQCAIGFSSGKTFNWVTQRVAGHWEIARCSPALKDYCRKEGNFEEIGDCIGQQGKRTDLEDAIATLQDGSLRDVAQSHSSTYVKYHRGLEALAYQNQTVHRDKPRVFWVFGPTGTGKSYLAARIAGTDPAKVWWSSDDYKWFDGYVGQNIAVFDDFRGDQCKFTWLLRLLDRYPVRSQTKGGFTNFTARTLFITCAVGPAFTYHGKSGEAINQLKRRICCTINTEKTDTFDEKWIETFCAKWGFKYIQSDETVEKWDEEAELALDWGEDNNVNILN